MLESSLYYQRYFDAIKQIIYTASLQQQQQQHNVDTRVQIYSPQIVYSEYVQLLNAFLCGQVEMTELEHFVCWAIPESSGLRPSFYACQAELLEKIIHKASIKAASIAHQLDNDHGNEYDTESSFHNDLIGEYSSHLYTATVDEYCPWHPYRPAQTRPSFKTDSIELTPTDKLLMKAQLEYCMNLGMNHGMNHGINGAMNPCISSGLLSSVIQDSIISNNKRASTANHTAMGIPRNSLCSSIRCIPSADALKARAIAMLTLQTTVHDHQHGKTNDPSLSMSGTFPSHGMNGYSCDENVAHGMRLSESSNSIGCTTDNAVILIEDGFAQVLQDGIESYLKSLLSNMANTVGLSSRIKRIKQMNRMLRKNKLNTDETHSNDHCKEQTEDATKDEHLEKQAESHVTAVEIPSIGIKDLYFYLQVQAPNDEIFIHSADHSEAITRVSLQL